MKARGQRGGALLEFAIAAPVMFVFFLAAIEFGWMAFAWHTANYAAKTGARWAAVRGARCVNTSAVDGQGNAVCPASIAAIQYYIKSTVPGLASSTTITPSWSKPPAGSVNQPTGTCGNASTSTAGCVVSVQVVNPFNLQVPFVYHGTINFSSTAQMTITGAD